MSNSRTANPLVTIILLCYNHEKFAAEAVAGVLSQTYSPLDIIICDDCSLDRTAEAIERTVSAATSRHTVRFIRNAENVGSNVVMRRALQIAKGKFIIVSCGDDIMLPQMVEEMVSILTDERLSLVTANALYIDENSRPLSRTFRELGRPADDSFETLARDGGNACCFGPAIAFDRAIYERFGWVPRYLRAYDIMYPFYAYLLNGAKFINKPLLKYRVHGGNTSVSLQAESADPQQRMAIEERAYLIHLAHAVLMEEELDRVSRESPGKYESVVQKIIPLLNVQMAEMSKKLIRSRRQRGYV